LNLADGGGAKPRHASWETIMSDAEILRQKAEMFERRAESATNPISKQHYREMAAHYRQLLVEHLDVRPEPHESAE
jgi:hypothetical protein